MCDVAKGSSVESDKLEAAGEGSSNELNVFAKDSGNKVMEGSVKTGAWVEEEVKTAFAPHD